MISNLAKLGNTGSIHDYDRTLARWSEEHSQSTLLRNHIDFVQRFEDFNDATDDAIVEIAQEGFVPPFLNDDILLRHELGARALQLAEDLRSQAMTVSNTAPPEVPPDMDRALSDFLGESED